jgi:hypothetical protein
MAIYFTSRLTSSHNSELPTHFTRALSSVEKSSWLSNALFFAKLYVLDLVDPFTRIYEKGSVGRFFHRQVEQLSDFEGVKTTLGTIATTVAEHPLDTLTIAQPFLAPQLGSELTLYIQNAISAVTLYHSANLSAHDLKKLAQSGLVGKLVILIALSSLPGASGATTCHYPSMVDACAGYNSHECATLTMGRIQETVQRCRKGNCENLSLEHSYTHHSNFEGFTPVSATGTCPGEEMCYLVAPAPDLPSIEVCWNPSKILEPRTFDQHDTLSPTFENFHVIGVGHSIYPADTRKLGRSRPR